MPQIILAGKLGSAKKAIDYTRAFCGRAYSSG